MLCITLLQIFYFAGFGSAKSKINETKFIKHGGDVPIDCPLASKTHWLDASGTTILHCGVGNEKGHPNISIFINVTKDCSFVVMNITQNVLLRCFSYESPPYIVEVKIIRPPSDIMIQGLVKDTTTIVKSTNDVIECTTSELLNLTCSVKSGEPPETLIWIKNNTELSVGGPGSLIYSFNPVLSDHMVIYTCIANNSINSWSLKADVQLKVIDTPTVRLIIEPNEMVRKGKHLKIVCKNTQTSSINDTYTWKHNLVPIANTMSTLVFEEIEVEASGEYECNIFNIAGHNKHFVYITVLDAPVVRNTTKVFTESDRHREVICNVSGIPNRYTFGKWMHYTKKRQLIRDVEGNQTLMLKMEHGDIQYDHTGIYQCNVTNGVPDDDGQLWVTGETDVIVKGKPVSVLPIKTLHIGHFNKRSVMNVDVLSFYKEVNAQWYDGGNKLLGEEKCQPTETTSEFFGRVVDVSGYRCQYKIALTKAGDLQNYTVIVKNQKGTVNFSLTLELTRAPETPKITSHKFGYDHILLEWIQGFDGRMTQHFEIQYRIRTDVSWVSLKNISHEKQSLMISHLEPDSEYEIRMRSSNSLGSSPWTTLITFKTSVEAKKPSRNYLLVLTIVLSVSVVAGCIGFANMLRRKMNRLQVPNGEVAPQETPEVSDEGGVYSMNGQPITLSNSNDIYNTRHGERITDQIRCRDIDVNSLQHSQKLNYVQVVFNQPSNRQKFVIRGAENRTPYAQIDLTTTADPLSSSDSDDNSTGDEPNDGDFMSLKNRQQWHEGSGSL